jgi:flagellar basal body-associated protein FliL
MKPISINKRANIPITILVLGVLLICGLAILSFYLSGQKSNEISNVSVLEKIKIQKEKMEFYNNLSVDFLESEFEIKTDERLGKEYLFMQEGNIEVWFYLP